MMIRPLSARPTMAPRKTRTTLAPTEPFHRLHWNRTWNDTKLTRNTPIPSMPPSRDRPVTSTRVKPDSLRILWQRRSNPSGFICARAFKTCSYQSGSSVCSSTKRVELCSSLVLCNDLTFLGIIRYCFALVGKRPNGTCAILREPSLLKIGANPSEFTAIFMRNS